MMFGTGRDGGGGRDFLDAGQGPALAAAGASNGGGTVGVTGGGDAAGMGGGVGKGPLAPAVRFFDQGALCLVGILDDTPTVGTRKVHRYPILRPVHVVLRRQYLKN